VIIVSISRPVGNLKQNVHEYTLVRPLTCLGVSTQGILPGIRTKYEVHLRAKGQSVSDAYEDNCWSNRANPRKHMAHFMCRFWSCIVTIGSTLRIESTVQSSIFASG
jgi:hypothetical protein